MALAEPKDRILLWAVALSLLLHLSILAKVQLPEADAFLVEPMQLSVQFLQVPKRAIVPAKPQARARPSSPAADKSQLVPIVPTGPVVANQLPVAPVAAHAAETAMPVPVAITQPRFDAEYLNNPRPAYPAMSRRLGEQGKVVLRVLVSGEGRAREVQVKVGSGSARLDQAAREAVERWRFVPARQGNEAVETWVLVPIAFNLS